MLFHLNFRLKKQIHKLDLQNVSSKLNVELVFQSIWALKMENSALKDLLITKDMIL